MKALIAGWLIALASFITGPTLGVALPQGTAVFETSLQSRISSTDTSLTLVTATSHGDTLSGYSCFTLDEGRTDAEFVCGTVSGNSVTSLERGISFSNGTTTSVSRAFAHRVGANVKVTDFPLIQRLRNQANGAETFPNLLSYASGLTNTAGTQQLASVNYVDAKSNAGAATSTESNGGLVELATLAEQASSFDGGASKPTVLQAKNSTSTCQVAGNYNIVASTTGKIDKNCIDQTAQYTLTGSTTLSATTSIAAISTTTAPLYLHGLAYGFPTTDGASSTVLCSDGHTTAPSLSWCSSDVRVLDQHSNSNTVQSTATTTVYTYAMPANTLGTGNKRLEFSAQAVSTTSAGGNCQIGVDIGTGSATTTIGYSNAGASLAGTGLVNGRVVATSTTSGITYAESSTIQLVSGLFGTKGTVVAAYNQLSYNFAATVYIAFRLASENSTSATCKLVNESVVLYTQN